MFYYAVDPRDHAHIQRIQVIDDERPDRTKRVKRFTAGKLNVLALQVSRGLAGAVALPALSNRSGNYVAGVLYLVCSAMVAGFLVLLLHGTKKLTHPDDAAVPAGPVLN